MDQLEIKATLDVSEAGEITGTAWPFGEADSVGDMITKGAFHFVSTELPVLYQHNPADLVGTWTEASETNEGLIVKGKMHLDQPRARTVLGMVKSGLISGLSIGFKAKSWTNQGRNRVIAALDLYEISLVRNPAHPRARISSAKEYDSASAVARVIRNFTASI